MNRTHRHGFALLIAIALIAGVGMAIAAIGMTMRNELLRTREASSEAQLRQLLLAGTQTARARLAGGANAAVNGAMNLPDSLSSDGASVTLTQESAAADQVGVRIEAAIGHKQLSQVVHFIQKNGAWQVDTAELGA